MDTYGKSYARFLNESWDELEKDFRKGIVDPQQENDVVCYLYYALANKFRAKGWLLSLIKTEDTKTIRKQKVKPDLNLNDRLFIEVKMWNLRKYGKGWNSRKEWIEYYADKLENYVQDVAAHKSVHVRRPILALWFWKNPKRRITSFEDKLIHQDLEDKLKEEQAKFKDRISILYGPKIS